MDDKKWRYCVIIYEVKERFKLSFEEYAYMDMIARQAAQFQSGWTNVSQETAGQILGVTDRSVRGYAKKLIAEGLIESEKIEGSYHTKKRATALWWKAINDSKKTTQEKFSATPEKTSDTQEKTSDITENFSNPQEKTSDYRNTYSNDYNNTFSEEKDISEKSNDFSPQTKNKKNSAKSNIKKTLFSQDENQTEKEKSCGKKEKAETPETEGEDYLTAGQLPTYNQLQIKPELWAAFVGAVVKRLPSQKPKNKIKRSIFVAWATKLKAIENKFADMVIVSHFQDYENKTWQSPFFTGYAETLQKAQKDYNFTNQNNNNQNATNQSITKPNAQPNADTFARVLKRDRELNELGY